ncbi:hypothetical protein [Paludibaculum fermentans]|uniref:YfhO family protein n=1 Tax=Paludibaculum fermentans TaxID=1473598 RepID=A0A7S7SP28_PALFE|nr:hypothetical protein [Paludibaculum fermentans]QOY91568.1 hypothetical protein IRI77_16955 [Paludibaculum fermentans]
MPEDPSFVARRHTRWVAPLILLALTTGIFWKLLTKQYNWLDSPDLAFQILPWFQFQASAWHAGEFPLWDPHLWGGQPLLGQMQPGAAYPLNWPLFLAPLHNGHIQPFWINLHFLFSHYLAALFCYLLCRDLGRSNSASILAGAGYALGGVLGTIGWPQMLSGAVWAPLVLLFYFRCLRGCHPAANAALSGAFLGISFLSGHHQIPSFTALAMGGFWLHYIWIQPNRMRALRQPAIAGMLLALVGALQLLPAIETGRLSLRWVESQNPVFWGQSVPYIVHKQHSFPPSSLLGVFIAGLSREVDPFLGFTLVALALLGLAACWKRSEVRLFGALAVGAVVFALGGFSVYHGVAYLLFPMVEKARTPAIAFFLAQLALAALAAFGLDAFRTEEIRQSTFVRSLIRGLLAFSAVAWSITLASATVRQETGNEYEALSLAAISAIGLAVLLHASRTGRIRESSAAALSIALLLFEFGTVTTANYQHRENKGGSLYKLTQHDDVVDFLRTLPAPMRLEVDTDDVPFNIGDWEGLEQFRAYSGGLTANVARFETDRLNGGHLAPMLFALGYHLGNDPMRDGQQQVFQGRAGLKVYRNPEAFPRYWSVHEAATVPSAEIIRRMGEEGGNLRRKALMTASAPPLETCGDGDELRLTARSSSALTFETTMRCRGLLVASETYFPGWLGYVDGQPAPLHEVYGALRGIVVNQGRHRVEMRYRPVSVYWGAGLTLLGLLTALAAGRYQMRAPEKA